MGNEGGRTDATPILTLEELNRLREIAENARKNVIKMLFYDQTLHVGSSLSSIEIITLLMFKYLRFGRDPLNRDYFILSKGHAAPALYAVMAEKGFIPEDELWKIQDISSILQGHPEIFIPGVDMATGSLGQGLSFGIGIATGIKMRGGTGRVFVDMGDGEHDEGEVWEAITHAVTRKLDNLIAIVEVNNFQLDDSVDNVKPKGYLPKVYEAVGWAVFEADGHDFVSLSEALEEALKAKRPSVIFARTVRGKGFPPIENTRKQRSSPDDARKHLINA
ncbi:MAG: transketolase [Sulfolobaceae archaeon]|nr:transketolase [Sulfolobales archaeon]MCQ4343994.1 transketolase [Sulfolobales archaeon]MCQ4385057.1 transketolase [Sulfolobales archaeon]